MAGERNQKLGATVTIGSVLQSSFRKNVGIVGQALGGINEKISETAKRQRELDRQRDIMRNQGEDVAALDREYEDLERTLGDLRRKQEAWNNVARQSTKVGQRFGTAQREIGKVARRAGVTIGAVGAGTFALARSTAQAGDRVAKTSRQLGIGEEAFQRLSFAAERSGVEQGTFESSMEAFTKRLGEFAATGKGEAADALEQLGLGLDDIRKKSPEGALAIVADRLQAVADPMERNAILADLFSRSGIAMATMLEGGSGQLRELGVEAENTGRVLSSKTLKDAEAFADEMTNVGSVIGGLKNTFGSELLPVVTDAMTQFREFAASNRTEIGEFAKAFANGVRDAIPVIADLASGLKDVGDAIARGTSAVADFVGGWDNLGIAIGAVVSAKAVGSVAALAIDAGKLAGAMAGLAGLNLKSIGTGFRAIGTALAANPIGLAITAIGLGAVLIVSNWDKIRPRLEPVFQWMGTAFETVKQVAEPIVAAIADAPGKIADAWDGLRTRLGAVMEWIKGQFESVLKFVEPVTNALGAVGRFFGGGDGSASPGRGGGGRAQRRAVGGVIGQGAAIVGERGPEALFGARSGFIATNRQLGAMLSQARQIGAGLRESLSDVQVPSPLDAARGVAGAVRGGRGQAGGGGGPVTVNNTFNVNGSTLTAAQLLDEASRRARQALEGALFDPPESFGHYDGGL